MTIGLFELLHDTVALDESFQRYWENVYMDNRRLLEVSVNAAVCVSCMYS